MKYRLATTADIPALTEMRWEYSSNGALPAGELYRDLVEHCTDFLQRALESGKWAIWIAEHEGEIVSHIYMQVIEKVPKPERLQNVYAYMTNVYTKPPYRGRGIGSELLRRACEWAKRSAMEFVIVWPSEAAVSFYMREGFQPTPDALELHFDEVQ